METSLGGIKSSIKNLWEHSRATMENKCTERIAGEMALAEISGDS